MRHIIDSGLSPQDFQPECEHDLRETETNHIFKCAKCRIEQCDHGNDPDDCQKCLHRWQAKYGGP